ncbi:MAG TPA: response regulator [Nitrososphaeraceae archaeon]|nr:response regulator [Nitrososphaeraceae archaeon]
MKIDAITNSFDGSIAIVDDEPDIVLVFIKVLQDNNYKVKGFTNPLLILEYLHQHPDEFDLIILDYRMSPMQGCELANEIAKINSRIKMVLLTAYNDIKNNALNLEIIKKPITLDEFLEIVERYMKNESI